MGEFRHQASSWLQGQRFARQRGRGCGGVFRDVHKIGGHGSSRNIIFFILKFSSPTAGEFRKTGNQPFVCCCSNQGFLWFLHALTERLCLCERKCQFILKGNRYRLLFTGERQLFCHISHSTKHETRRKEKICAGVPAETPISSLSYT